MASAGSSGHGSATAGGGEVEYGQVAPPIPSVPDNESPYPDEGASLLQLLQWQPTTNFTIGVYTHTDGDHYLIKVASGRISAAPLSLTNQGQSLKSGYLQTYPDRSIRSTIIGGSGEQVKHEAYVLGQSQTLGDWVEIGEYRLEGNALHYGWNFNWNGSSAICITQKKNNTVDDVLINWTARQYMLSIVEIQVGDESTLEATVSMTSANWEPDIGKPHVWYPTSDGKMYPVLFVGCNQTTVQGYGESEFDAPIYGYYKSDDTLKTISYRQTALPEYSIAELVQEGALAICTCPGNAQPGAGVQDYEYQGYTAGYELEFFTSDGESYKETTSFGGHYRRRWVEVTDNGSEYRSAAGIVADEFEKATRSDAPAGYNSSDWYTGTVEKLEESTGGTPSDNVVTATPALIFARHSTESAYILIHRHQHRGMSRVGEISYTSQLKMRAIDSLANPIGDFIDVWYPAFAQVNCTPGELSDVCMEGHIWIFQGAGYPDEVEETVNEYVTTDKYKIKLHLLTAFETTQVDELEVDEFFDLGVYSGVVTPAICTEDSGVPYYKNYQSALGNSIRLESGFDYSYGSNSDLSPDVADPYGLFLGRA